MLRASLISFLALGVVAQEPPKTPASPSTPAPVVAPAPAVAPVAKPTPKPEEVVLAKVGDEVVTEADYPDDHLFAQRAILPE